jgi:ElaB/YqjD/DUF883 family membrane-anchored ribosome-binding protein
MRPAVAEEREDRQPREKPTASTERIRARGREARDEGRAFVEATRGLVSEIDELARARLDAAPFATLALAFGVGVFLGGGVPFAAVRLAGRAAAGTLIRQALAGALPAAAAVRS